MLKIIRPRVPLETQGTINRLNADNEQLRQGMADAEAALVELADMVAAQDDALVEIAELGGE